MQLLGMPLTEWTPVILTISAMVAFWAVRRNQIIARKRATIDLVLAQRSDEKLQVHKDCFVKLNDDKNGNNLATYASKPHKGGEEAKAILGVLNNYEFIAAGIREGAFCEKTYKRMVYGILVQDYEALKGFIQEVRRSREHKTLFQEFEWLGKKWKKKPLKKNEKDQ